MSEELKKKLDQRMNRRTFLKGSSLAAALVAGAAAFPAIAFAQSQDQRQDAPAEKTDEKKDEKPADQNAEKKDDAKPEEDEFKITRKDENGRDYRLCPQCGYNMYKQDRTWTCENCGYSYAE